MAGLCEGGNEPPGSLKAKKTTYNMINQRILDATSAVANESISMAAEEEARLTNSRDVSVSCDEEDENKPQEIEGLNEREKLSDGKTLGGRNRLTDAVINTLTVYYGNAIRANCGSVDNMRTAIWAIWYHKMSSDHNPVHNFCPKGLESWCPYQRAVEEKTVDSYKHKNNLAPAIMEAIKPVFKNLVSTDLLKRCVGGFTQNNNESLNSKIWKICPKVGFAGHKIVKVAVNDAVIGKYCLQALEEQDTTRIQSANKRALQATKEAKKCRKRLRLEIEAKVSDKEGVVYAAGEF
ncbi:hypothetical protein ANN_02828 [Periplaneta americana]|uniref:Mutator-like transposase domain-containing protein n=1 Tax=Periplaneta americana TaxID=6978 RepID=A0ABQ8TZU2_PERAM|nr:hypothetical protein ANN_02828 [Periplaneta americana]